MMNIESKRLTSITGDEERHFYDILDIDTEIKTFDDDDVNTIYYETG